MDHIWIVSVTYVITSAQAEELAATNRVDLPENYAVLGPICFRCEATYEEAAATCPGDADADTEKERAESEA